MPLYFHPLAVGTPELEGHQVLCLVSESLADDAHRQASTPLTGSAVLQDVTMMAAQYADSSAGVAASHDGPVSVRIPAEAPAQ